MNLPGKICCALILVSGLSFDSNAQIYVTVRPPRPSVVITRTPQPGPEFVWVEEEWRPSGNRYEWAGGHWVPRPHHDTVWLPGHWIQERRGDYWVSGRWNDKAYKHDHGKHKGWYKEQEKEQKHLEKEEEKDWKKEHTH